MSPSSDEETRLGSRRLAGSAVHLVNRVLLFSSVALAILAAAVMGFGCSLSPTAEKRVRASIQESQWAELNGDVGAIQVAGGVVYLGGEFSSVGGTPRNSLAALDAATGAATRWNPSISGSVTTLAVEGASVYVGGYFSSAGGVQFNLAAFDRTSGRAGAWSPDVEGIEELGGEISALLVKASTVYVGGEFLRVGGRRRRGLAATDIRTGKATAWDPRLRGLVTSLAVRDNIIYVGGSFTSVQGQPRENLAAFDARTGLLTNWNPRANGEVDRLLVSGNGVYAGGFFTRIGHSSRHHLARIDASSGKVAPWNPGANDAVVALTLAGRTLYVGGFFTRVGNHARRHLAAIDVASGRLTSWRPTVDGYGEVAALMAIRDAVLVGGTLSSISGVPHQGFAAVAR
jgi:hypothetical protein